MSAVDKIRVLEFPGVSEAVDLCRWGSGWRLVQVFGECEVWYEGRASSSLGLGDRLIVVKPDGSLLVHQGWGREPVNWQPPGSKHSFTEIEGKLKVSCYRIKPKEVLEVLFNEVYLITSLLMKDDKELVLNGSELEYSKWINENPEFIEDGFQPIKKERETGFGFIDVLGKDSQGRIVVVEVKRRRVGPEAVSQLKRYVNYISQTKHHTKPEKVRGILVAPSITKKAKQQLESEELEFISLKPQKETMTTLNDF
ncbi:MAG: endonuclease NucS [Archaeoglobaceae archaeon]